MAKKTSRRVPLRSQVLRREHVGAGLAPALSPLLVILFLLSSFSLWGGQPTRPATPTATTGTSSILPSPAPENLQSLLQTEQLLLMTPHPLRDLYDLARRLKLHTACPFLTSGVPRPSMPSSGRRIPSGLPTLTRIAAAAFARNLSISLLMCICMSKTGSR